MGGWCEWWVVVVIFCCGGCVFDCIGLDVLVGYFGFVYVYECFCVFGWGGGDLGFDFVLCVLWMGCEFV